MTENDMSEDVSKFERESQSDFFESTMNVDNASSEEIKNNNNVVQVQLIMDQNIQIRKCKLCNR